MIVRKEIDIQFGLADVRKEKSISTKYNTVVIQELISTISRYILQIYHTAKTKKGQRRIGGRE